MQYLQLHQIISDAKSGLIQQVELFYSKSDGVRLFVTFQSDFTEKLGCLVTQRNEVRHFKTLDSAYKVALQIVSLLPGDGYSTTVTIKGEF